MRSNEPSPTIAFHEPLEIPPSEPVSQEEIERRRDLFAQVMARRATIGLIGISAEELIHQVRDETDGSE
jgi:hypothetical protein